MTTRQRTQIDFDLASDPNVLTLIRMSLEEDLGSVGDVTSSALMPDARMSVVMVAREACVQAGLGVAAQVFQAVEPGLAVTALAKDGEAVEAGAELLRIEGSAIGVLSAERTALNFVQHLSGIATVTRSYVDVVEDLGTQILDTRKTTPGWRLLEKYAVHCGGGVNHRAGLYDQILIKDNHLAHWRRSTGKSIAEAVEAARASAPGLLVEVEADTVPQVQKLLEAKPDWILLDNMSFVEMEMAVDMCKGISRTEASGGITMDTLRGVAETGVDAISVGALTHSVRSVDIALDAAS
ncbi:carboxylating nicotinate-nucleotide diphosphorylase [Kiritimatiellaeota bacterium B1221]|nr:carboxylating nicotinate-nucleotide diphosphorylase [Kiritimatiellaeota bacterium B1221]